jgi:hypothetical protein
VSVPVKWAWRHPLFALVTFVAGIGAATGFYQAAIIPSMDWRLEQAKEDRNAALEQNRTLVALAELHVLSEPVLLRENAVIPLLDRQVAVELTHSNGFIKVADVRIAVGVDILPEQRLALSAPLRLDVGGVAYALRLLEVPRNGQAKVQLVKLPLPGGG